jgi:hypothetical protein
MRRKYVRPGDITVLNCRALCTGNYGEGLDFTFDVHDARTGVMYQHVTAHLEDGQWSGPVFNDSDPASRYIIQFNESAHLELQSAVTEQLVALSDTLIRKCAIESCFDRETSASSCPRAEAV